MSLSYFATCLLFIIVKIEIYTFKKIGLDFVTFHNFINYYRKIKPNIWKNIKFYINLLE